MMDPYPSEGTCNDRAKRKTKRRSTNTTAVEIKEEIVVKEEPREKCRTAEVTRQLASLSIETSDEVNSEYETDSEMYSDYDADCMKKEIKSRKECAKKEKDLANDASSNNGDDLGDIPVGENVDDSGPSSNSNGEKKKRQVKDKKPKDRKKETNATSSKNAALKRQRKHVCHLCTYSASDKSNLTKHIRVHTGEKPFVCKVYAKAITTKSNLRNHEKTHGPRLAFRCSKCRQGFTHEIHETDHESKCQRHQYECYACKYTTFKLSIMKDHMRIHSGRKPFECSVCSKTFSHKHNLRGHLRIHIKQLPFACSKCGQRFKQENKEQLHENRCNGRRFECHLCKFECFYKSQLEYHMRAQHTSEKPFHCELCDARFTSRGHVNQHTKHVHRRKK